MPRWKMVEDSGTTLLEHKSNGSITQTQKHRTGEPPDGGTRAWLVLVGSFFCNGILFGVINSYGVLYTEFHDIFEKKGSLNPSGEAGEGKNRSQEGVFLECTCFLVQLGLYKLFYFCFVNHLQYILWEQCGLKTDRQEFLAIFESDRSMM